jgi:hypothetical protein
MSVINTVISILTHTNNGIRRPLIRESLLSFFKYTNLDGSAVFIDDHGSNDEWQKELMNSFHKIPNVTIRLHRENVNAGTNRFFDIPLACEENPEAHYLVLLDDDLLYQHGWLQFAQHLLDTLPNAGVVGLCRHRAHAVQWAYSYPEDPRYTIFDTFDTPGGMIIMSVDTYRKTKGWPPLGSGSDSIFMGTIRMNLEKKLYAISPPILRHVGYVSDDGKPVRFDNLLREENKTFIPLLGKKQNE